MLHLPSIKLQQAVWQENYDCFNVRTAYKKTTKHEQLNVENILDNRQDKTVFHLLNSRVLHNLGTINRT